MKHTVRHIKGDRWSVMDADDATAFSGTLRECEDWLDRRENRQRARASLFRRVSRWFRQFGSGGTVAPQPHGRIEGSQPKPVETPAPNEVDRGPASGESE